MATDKIEKLADLITQVSCSVVLPWSGFGVVIPESMMCSGGGNETAATVKIKAVWPVSFQYFADQSPCWGFPCLTETGKCTLWRKCALGTRRPNGSNGIIVPVHEVKGEWSTSHPGRFTLDTHWIGWMGSGGFGEEKNIPCRESKPGSPCP